jgi:thiol-disulfide isomerase/thioredoxin
MFAPRFPDSTDVVDATHSKMPVRAQPLQPGDPAPEWQVSAWTDGHSRKLSDFRGKVVLLDFWGVWCAPCLQGLPAIQAIQDKFGDQVVCLEIHTAGADIAKVQKMLDSKSVKSPSAIDQGAGRKGITGQRYGVESWPHMVLIDREGKVAWTTLDANTESVMSDAAKAADIPWPPKDMSDEQMHRLRTGALSILIEKILASPAVLKSQVPSPPFGLPVLFPVMDSHAAR